VIGWEKIMKSTSTNRIVTRGNVRFLLFKCPNFYELH